MGKEPRPKREEVEFIFRLFLDGYKDGDILTKYTGLQEAEKLKFPYRTDVRLIKQLREEFNASRIVLEPYLKQQIDPALAHKREEHWNVLSSLAEELSQNPYVRQPYYLWHVPDFPKKLDALQILLHQSETRRPVEGSQVDWRFYPDLMTHIEAEYPEWRTDLSNLKKELSTYFNLLRSLSQKIRQEAQKSRTGLLCEKQGKLTDYFGEAVFADVYSRAKYDEQTRVITFSDKPERSNYESRGDELWYSGVPIARCEQKKHETVKQAHQALMDSIQKWTEVPRAYQAFKKTEKALQDLKAKLEEVSKRKTFTGRCPSCP